MKYDFDIKLVDFEGEHIPWPTKKKKINKDTGQEEPVMGALTLGKACIEALLCQHDDDREKPADERLEWFTLARRLAMGGKHDLLAEDIVTITERLPYMWSTLVMGLVRHHLDNPLPETDDDPEDDDPDNEAPAETRRPARRSSKKGKIRKPAK